MESYRDECLPILHHHIHHRNFDRGRLVFIVGKGRSRNRVRLLVGLALSCIVAGILFGENRYIGYGMMALGVIVAVIDILLRPKAK